MLFEIVLSFEQISHVRLFFSFHPINQSIYMLVLVHVLLLTNPQKLWTDDNIHFLFSIKGFKLDLHVTIWKLPFIHQFLNNVDSLIMPPFLWKQQLYMYISCIRYFYISTLHLHKQFPIITLGIYNPPKRTWKQYLCKILGGKQGVLWLMWK